MNVTVARRKFVAALCSAAAWPLAARAQQATVPVIGYLTLGSPENYREAAFRKGLSETGYVEGRNVAVEYHFAGNDRLTGWAADLVCCQVAVIVAQGNAAAFAAKAAMTTIPIVFSTGGDPVQNGLVANLNRPGGNVTGFSGLQGEVVSKLIG